MKLPITPKRQKNYRFQEISNGVAENVKSATWLPRSHNRQILIADFIN